MVSLIQRLSVLQNKMRLSKEERLHFRVKVQKRSFKLPDLLCSQHQQLEHRIDVAGFDICCFTTVLFNPDWYLTLQSARSKLIFFPEIKAQLNFSWHKKHERDPFNIYSERWGGPTKFISINFENPICFVCKENAVSLMWVVLTFLWYLNENLHILDSWSEQMFHFNKLVNQ